MSLTLCQAIRLCHWSCAEWCSMGDWVQAPLILESGDWMSGEFLAWVLAAQGNFYDFLTNRNGDQKTDIMSEAA